MVEFYTGKRSKFTYDLETTYGTQIAEPDAYVGKLLNHDPKDEIVYVEIPNTDTASRDLDSLVRVVEKYGYVLRFRPQHMVPFGLAYGTDESKAGTPNYHGLIDLAAEDYDIPSFTSEISSIHSTAASGHTVWYDGCKVNTFELSFRKGELLEANMDIVAQDSGSSDDSGNAFDSTNARHKSYAVATKRPYAFSDIKVEWEGVQIFPLNGRIKVEHDLWNDVLCDDTLPRRIAEPIPQRRLHEFEFTIRMDTDDYYDKWKTNQFDGRTLGSTTGLLINNVSGITAIATTIDYDGTASPAGSVPSRGILKIDNEYIFYSSKTASVFTVVRGMFGSTGATHADNAAITIYGNVNLQINRGSTDYGYIGMWDGQIKTYGNPREVGGGILEQTFLYQPLKVAVMGVDDIGQDYVNSTGTMDA